jgi:hypothetical protein
MVMPAPTKLRIRSYNVGFGDCFLLTFSYGAGERDRNVLIDFGSTKKSDFAPEGGMAAIARQIGRDCGEKLDMVVATHRHRDHISGFSRTPGTIIKALEPELVVQPWTEDPRLEPNATGPRRGLRARGLVARLSDMQALAAEIHAQVPRLKASPEVPAVLRAQIEFLGETNLKNAAAVRNLRTMGKREPVFASFGTKLPIADLLPGVKIDVIGPPTLVQSKAVARQRERDENEFWHLRARAGSGNGAARGARLFPGAVATGPMPQEARWVIPRIDAMHAGEMLAIVRRLDEALNNTSLILLIEVLGEVLVFPGDAQIENWSYALFEAPNRRSIRNRLRRAAFYKVGHHGSLNATPKTLWKDFARKNTDAAPDRLWTMVSTAADLHGDPEDDTEVPRETLVTALGDLSDFRNTQTITSRTEFWHDVEIPRSGTPRSAGPSGSR